MTTTGNAIRVISATAAHVTFVRFGVTAVQVLDGNTGRQIGYAEKIRGFIHYTGTKGTAHGGVKAVLTSSDSTYSALERALKVGLVNGRDDRS